jgi:hypothetical protein
MRFFEPEAPKSEAVARRRGEARGLAQEEQLFGLVLDFV